MSYIICPTPVSTPVWGGFLAVLSSLISTTNTSSEGGGGGGQKGEGPFMMITRIRLTPSLKKSTKKVEIREAAQVQ